MIGKSSSRDAKYRQPLLMQDAPTQKELSLPTPGFSNFILFIQTELRCVTVFRHPPISSSRLFSFPLILIFQKSEIGWCSLAIPRRSILPVSHSPILGLTRVLQAARVSFQLSYRHVTYTYLAERSFEGSLSFAIGRRLVVSANNLVGRFAVLYPVNESGTEICL